jgi:hypothetical protein
MRRSGAITAVRRLDVLAQMICVHVLARSRIQTVARDRSLFCVKGPFGGALGQRRGRGRSVVVGSGSDCSEVPVFRVQPATLD